MEAVTVGALIGGAVDSLAGDDNPTGGALIGAGTAAVLKIVLPPLVTFAVGWVTLRALGQLRGTLATGSAQ